MTPIKISKINPTVLSVALFSLGIGTFLYLCYQFTFTQDDAFITFRYALNFLSGNGLVYNIGEHVEGYTNFLWTLFMIIGAYLNFDLPTFSRIIGIFFGLATLAGLYVLSLTVFENYTDSIRKILAGAVALIAGAALSFAYWSVSGLETVSFAFWILLALLTYLRKSYMLPATLVLATLTRPEGGLLFFFVIIYDFLSERKITRYSLITISVYALFLLPFAGFKILYYHSLLPNSFYAKTSFSMNQVINGLSYAGRYFFDYLGAGLFLLPAIFALKKVPRSFRFVFSFVAIYCAYIILIGGDVLKVHRFFVPLIPLFALISLGGIYFLLRKKVVIFVALVVILGWQSYMPYKYVYTFYEREQALANKMDFLIDQLKEADTSNFSISTSTIGLIGYKLMGHTVIDMLGLTDSTIARHPEQPIDALETTWRESHYNTGYLLSRHPKYILFSTGFKPSAPAERALFLYSAFWHSYRTIGFRAHHARTLNSIYRLYKPIPQSTVRDIPVGFVQSFNAGINALWREKNYTKALASLNNAQSLYPNHNNPYIFYYMAVIYLHANRFEASYRMLDKVISTDSLVYEAYQNLFLYNYRLGNMKKAEYYRAKTIELVPWYATRLDSLARGQI